ncbi:MAG: PAS domain S-box protein [Deltaproteobacteria bacterium]|nr:PAS domain S-box protein [Deltaproteobacteria bacterium]
MKDAGVLTGKGFASAQCRGIPFYSALTTALMVAFSGLWHDASADTIPSPSDPAPQVLVIHSYYPTFTWADNITRGIRRAFSEDPQNEVALDFEFLDAKRHPEPAYLNQMADLLRMKYPDPEAVDVIVCSDDQALNFLLDRSDTLFPGVPVVFCGVNGYTPEMRNRGRPLTGVVEAIDPKRTLEAALRLRPSARQVLVIADETLTGKAIENSARKAFEPFQERLRVRYVGDMTMPELQETVSGLSPHTIVFLFVFNRDKNGHNFTHEDSLRCIASHCKAPIYGPWTFYLGHGIVGGMLTSGEMQGRTAARLARRILRGEQVEDIPVILESPNRYMFDHAQLTAHNLPLERLPPGSRIINRPDSLYGTYRYPIWVTIVLLIGQTAVIVLLLVNIRRRRHAEKALISSEQRYRMLIETISDGVFTSDTSGRFTFLNPEFERITGYPVRDFLGRPFTEILAPEYIDSTMEKYRRGLAGETIPMYEVELKHKGGGTVPVELKVTSLLDPAGNPMGRIGVARDITDRKHAEAVLKESEAKFRSFFDLSPQAIALSDAQTGKLLDVNKMLCELTQYSPEEIIGKRTTEVGFYSEQDRIRFVEALKTSGEVHGLHMNFRAKDGSILNALMFARVIRVAGKGLIITIFVDTTEQQRLEGQLIRAQKMEALGALAGGVAHDLNNILSGIVSYPELILMDLPQDSPLRKRILTIKKSGERAAAIVQDLLTLARRGVAVTEATNLNHIINAYLKSPECQKLEEFHPGVSIETDLDKNLLNIMGSPVHLSKTVMNLVSNGAEAMNNGGTVSISTRNQYIDQPLKGYEDVKEGDYAVLSVSDSGIGILSEDVKSIFEPFYTKKAMGRSGTGLGMAVVWGTLKDHGGYIDIQSIQGKGTTFTLYFPVTRNEITGKEESLPVATYMGKGETILLVDDVEEQREIGSEILEKLGYSVTCVPSGEAAVNYLKTQSADLIVLDMIMDPGMDGLDTYKRILQLHPGQKVVIASGFSETERVKEAQRLGAGPYIKKPYTIEKIGVVVKQALNRE